MPENKKCLIAHYGVTVSREDAIVLAAIFGVLETYLHRALQRSPATTPDAGEAPKASLKHAQRLFSRLQRDLNFLHRSDIEIHLKGIGITIQDLQSVCLHRGTVHDRASEFLRDRDSAWIQLAAELLLDGILDQFLLTVAAIKKAADQARILGIQSTRQIRGEAEAICCWLNWQKDMRSLRKYVEGLGIQESCVNDAVESIGMALAFVRYKNECDGKERQTHSAPVGLRTNLSPRPKLRESLVRAIGSRDTIQHIQENKDRFGITRVTDTTGLDIIGVPNYSVIRPLSKTRNTVQSGKGLTHEDALASGLLEAAELVSAERVREGPVKIIKSAWLAGDFDGAKFVDPREFVLPSTFAEHDFDPALPMEWVKGTDLVRDAQVWVPLEVVAMADFERVYNPIQTSNGLGAGNSLEEAILHGLCECVERDLYKCAWFAMVEAGLMPQRVGVHRINLETLPPAPGELVKRVRSAGLRPYLIDCSLDSAIPTVWAVLLEETGNDRGTGHPMDGFVANMGHGTHPNPEVAVLRALLEAIQTHTVNIQGTREDLDSLKRTTSVRIRPRSSDQTAMDAGDLRGWRREYSHSAIFCERFARLVLDPFSNEVSLSDLGGKISGDVLEDIEFVVTRLCRMGLTQVIYVDLQQPDLRVPVVRVLVPGLEPITLDRTGWRCFRYLYEPASWTALHSTTRVA
jgi:YcaO-like protein with predicted kinase domain